MEPWQSWAIVGVASVGAYLYYNRQQTNVRGAGKVLLGNEQPQVSRRRNESKAKRKDKTPGSFDEATSDVTEVGSASAQRSGDNNVRKRKGGRTPVDAAAKSSATDMATKTTPVLDVDHDDDSMDNKEFARQLSGAKKGTSLEAPAKASQSKRSKKLGKAEELRHVRFAQSSADEDLSTTSSTTGADAVDDLSSSNSPALGAAPDQSGISDMLEAPSRGPSVLRLTEPMQPQRSNQPKSTKATQAPETKKQRQNRRKNEERKLEREQAEKERRVLLEKQLRTAREAEGRPARNGVPVSKPPTNSAWTKQEAKSSAKNINLDPPSTDENGDALLDTFEDTSVPEVATSNGYRPSNATGLDRKAWEQQLPSEEEQMRLLNEINSDGWQTVEKPKKRDKLATTASTDEDKLGNGKTARTAATAPEFTKEDFGKVDDKGYKHGKYLPYADTGHPDDSDWPVV
ncbi:hypothetical protein MMC14_004925 [Varicellaria rhodocarpa]|nr:hypothetical protein [Varicellaria rhodocarpa]